MTPHQSRRQRFVAVVSAILLLAAAAAAAEDQAWHSNADIRTKAESHVLGLMHGSSDRTTVRAGSLDPRHRLPQCDRSLDTFMRRGTTVGSRTVVGVECRGRKPWKVFVPVDVVVLATVFTARNTLPRGHVLSKNDLAVAERDVSRMPRGYMTSVEALLGQRTKQQIIAGRLITPAMLEANRIVSRGQTVTLAASNDELAVSMTGIALTDGALNQRIRVENSNSGRVVEGIVRSREVVEILLPESHGYFTARPKVPADSADKQVGNNDR